MMATRKEFLRNLEAELSMHLLYPNTSRENDLAHSRRLIRRAPEIRDRCSIEFDMDEFVAVALLHEIDRSYSLNARFLFTQKGEFGIKAFALGSLKESDFSEEARMRIVKTVVEHNKRDDDLEHDPGVLTALRIADKLDRMGPYGILTAIIHRCPAMPLFDPIQPFLYKSSVEGKLNSAYNDWMRVFEWWGMLPFNSAREMIEKKFRDRIYFVRKIAAEYAANTGVENLVEEDLKTALGIHYAHFAP